MEQAEKFYDTYLSILAYADGAKISSQGAAITLEEKRVSEAGLIRMTH